MQYSNTPINRNLSSPTLPLSIFHFPLSSPSGTRGGRHPHADVGGGGGVGVAGRLCRANSHPVSHHSASFNADRVGISLALRANITAQRAISRCQRQHITATLRVARVGGAGRLCRTNSHPVNLSPLLCTSTQTNCRVQLLSLEQFIR